MTPPYRVLITAKQMQDCIDGFRPRLTRLDVELELPQVERQQLTEDELIALIPGVNGVIAGDDPFTKRVLSHAHGLRAIAKWGIGVDNIDLDDARRRGIEVTNTPAVFGEDVADVAAGYLVMLARQLHVIHESVSTGGWLKVRGRALSGSALGIVGFGSVGQALARRGAGFDMQVLAHDIADSAHAAATADGIALVALDDLVSRSDFIVLCVPLTRETHHMVDGRLLSLMQPGSYLVNVARGGLVDETALITALGSGRVAAAALDVFETEPLPGESALRTFPQCVFGSHNASNTARGVVRASTQAIENLLHGLGLEP